MKNTIELWKCVIQNHQLLEHVATSQLEDVATMATLRKQWSVDEITIAASLIDARNRAKGKLTNCETIVADSVGVQQATSTRIAQHKAKRFTTEGHVFDLCCGIGSDLQALPSNTIGIDNDPLRCWMASINSGKETRTEDMLLSDIPSDAVIHIDPSRRSGETRLHTLDAMQPTIDEVAEIAMKCDGGCIKVSPAVNAEDLEEFQLPFELEYIEEHGRVVQCVIWFGSCMQHANKVTATSITHDVTISDMPSHPPFGTSIKGWILEPNPALERSGLHGTLGHTIHAHEIAPKLGLLCSEFNPNSPWFQSFEILETTPLRLEKVAKTLANLECTQVEVKTRDKTVDPNEWQKKLTTHSHGPLLTVFALRLVKKRVAVITRRHIQP